MTRTEDVNLAGASRARVAREYGADIFVSIHFNAANVPVIQKRGPEAFIRNKRKNTNYQDEYMLASRLLFRVVNAISQGISNTANRGVKEDDSDSYKGSLAVLNEAGLGKSTAGRPVRACLLEVDFIDRAPVDQFFNTSPNAEANCKLVAEAIAQGLIDDVEAHVGALLLRAVNMGYAVSGSRDTVAITMIPEVSAIELA